MATSKATEEIRADKRLVYRETMEELRRRVENARNYRSMSRGGADNGRSRAAFIEWSESAAEARGFLDCLMTLNLLSVGDETAWYEYLSGACDSAPGVDVL